MKAINSINWLKGMETSHHREKILKGGLLADDMGLGKNKKIHLFNLNIIVCNI